LENFLEKGYRMIPFFFVTPEDYADAFSHGFVHRKLKPKIAAQFSGFLFLNAYQNEF
jgi:hypothetical protein